MREKKAIGTVATPVTLTAAFTGNTVTLVSRCYKKMRLDIKYTPKAAQTNRYLYVLVEESNDNGVTFFPKTVSIPLPDRIDLYNLDQDSSATGIPLIIPNAGASTGGTAYSVNYDCDICSDFLKVSLKESGSGNNGTAYVNIILTQEDDV